MNSPTPGEFYLFLSSSILSEASSFPRSFPRLWARTHQTFTILTEAR